MKTRTLVYGGATALVLSGVAIGYLAGRARAAIPTTSVLTYSGVLTDTAGAPLTGSKNIQLQVWDAVTDGMLKCTVGPTATTLAAGAFQMTLPATCVTAVQSSGDLWIEAIVNGESLGRSKLGAVPYAVEAGHAGTADMAVSSTPPTVVKATDDRAGCPGTGPANIDIMPLTFTLARGTTVKISGDIIRNATGRVDLALVLDGAAVMNTVTYTPTAQWAPAHVEWVGTLAAGAHAASVRSATADVWGCGATWGSLQAIYF